MGMDFQPVLNEFVPFGPLFLRDVARESGGFVLSLGHPTSTFGTLVQRKNTVNEWIDSVKNLAHPATRCSDQTKAIILPFVVTF
jgi:hypothetical protein